jgi:hypothetical protein
MCAGHLATARQVAFGGIVLQKSQVAAPRFSGENKKREAIADSRTFNRVAEVTGEFNVKRSLPLTSLHERRASGPQNF